MANENDEDERSPGWTGDEVQDAPPGEAEQAADRAEGNRPVRTDTEHERPDEPLESEPEDEVRRAPSGASPDEKIAEAAEEHREREATGRPPRGKI
jgi:hypothetical protein